MSSNLVQHQCTKHIEIDLHFVQERVAIGAVHVMHVPTSAQYADIFTKGLLLTPFFGTCQKIGEGKEYQVGR